MSASEGGDTSGASAEEEERGEGEEEDPGSSEKSGGPEKQQRHLPGEESGCRRRRPLARLLPRTNHLYFSVSAHTSSSPSFLALL